MDISSGVVTLRRQVLLAAATAALLTLVSGSAWLAALERPAGDLLLRVPRPGAAAPVPLAVVAVDDAAVRALGPLPWPRARLAALVDATAACGARAVALDLLLSEAGDAAGDAALARSLARTPHVLAAGLGDGGRWLLPIDVLGGAVSAAHAHVETSSDGVLRVVSATKQAGDLALPALAWAVARLAGATGALAPGAALRPGWRVAPDDVVRVGAAALLAGEEECGVLEGRVVLIGVTATGSTDQLVVPVGPRAHPRPGVLVHAAAAAALLAGDLVRPAGPATVLAAAFAAALAVQLLRSRAGRLRWRHLIAAALAVAAAALGLLWSGGIMLPVLAVTLAVPSSALAREVAESRAAQRETGRILVQLLAGATPVTALAPPAAAHLPRGTGGRLRLVRELQERVVLDRDLRRALLDGLGEGVLLWGADGSPRYANPAGVRLVGSGVRLQELAGERPGEPPADTVEIERGGRQLELHLQRLGPGWLGLVRDVSDERQLEQRRRDMQRLVTHELKTPLAAIAGFAEMLERYRLSDDERLGVGRRIRGEALRLAGMVSTLLDLERLGDGQWAAERRRVDLGVLAERVAERARAPADGVTARVVVDAAEGQEVMGVAELLEQAVANLVGNALVHGRPQGEVRVTVRGAPGEVSVVVADDGPGIAAEALPHVFERFYRAPGRRSTGSGLGLALVRAVVDWHGGCIDVDSRPGAGARFTVRLPAAPPNGEGAE